MRNFARIDPHAGAKDRSLISAICNIIYHVRKWGVYFLICGTISQQIYAQHPN